MCVCMHMEVCASMWVIVCALPFLQTTVIVEKWQGYWQLAVMPFLSLSQCLVLAEQKMPWVDNWNFVLHLCPLLI